MKFIGIYHQMNCNPMLFYQLLVVLLLLLFFHIPFFRHYFFASNHSERNAIAMENVTMYAFSDYVANLFKTILLWMSNKKHSRFANTHTLCCSVFLVHLLKRNLILAKQLRNKCKTLKIEIRRGYGILFAFQRIAICVI